MDNSVNIMLILWFFIKLLHNIYIILHLHCQVINDKIDVGIDRSLTSVTKNIQDSNNTAIHVLLLQHGLILYHKITI